MGLFDKIRGKGKEESAEAEPESSSVRYTEACALCGGTGTEKKWAGQYWHKKCLRKSKKFAKGMF